MNSQGLWNCATGEIKWFHLKFDCLAGDEALKISATKRGGGGFADCRTQAGAAAALPLWEAHWSRKQPDRKRTSVLTSAAGSRVLGQSNLSCWKQKCDLTFYSNVNAFIFIFLFKSWLLGQWKLSMKSERSSCTTEERERVQCLTGSTGSETHRTEASPLERDTISLPPSPDNDNNTGFFFWANPCRHLINHPHYQKCPPVLRCPFDFCLCVSNAGGVLARSSFLGSVLYNLWQVTA